jgi:tetratricopeptide (TPR) repeat protein
LDLQRSLTFVGVFLLAVNSPALPAAASLEARLEKAKSLEEGGSSTEARKAYEALLTEGIADPHTHAGVLRALAKLDGQLGDYDAAARRAGQSAAEFRALHDAADEAGALNNLGVAELYSGSYDAAEGSLAGAVSLSTRAGDREGEAEQLSNLANAYYFQARYLDALGTYGRALDLAQKASAEPWAARRKAVVLINMATVYQRLGQDSAAMDLYRRAREQTGVLRTNEEAQLLTNLGVLYRRLGDPFKALETYGQARALFSRDPHHDGELTVVMNRGIVLALDLGRLDDAGRAFAEARRLAHERGSRRDEMQADLYAAETLYRQGKYGQAGAGFEQARAGAVALGTGEEEWKALYGLARVALRAKNDGAAKKLLLEAVAKIESLRGKLRLASLKSDFFADKREVYDALIALRLKDRDPAEIFGYMERSRSRTLQDRLQIVGSFSLERLRASLDGRSAVLEFWLSPRGAAVLFASRAGAWISPITVDSSAVQTLQETLASGGEWRPAAQTVGLSAIPANAIPEGVTRLVVVADGALESIPFEVLPYGGRLMVERYEISYEPAAALLLREPAKGRRKLWPWSTNFVGFGNPLFSSEALPNPDSRPELAGSAGEVTAIARMLPGRSRVFLGAANRQEMLRTELISETPVLHLATHATADPENPERSRILFSPAKGGGGAADYLFLKRVYDLNLRDVDLVTLSACDTESGKLVRGEGVQGFSRAFLATGARSVVATLWKVVDAPTAEFMKMFYRNLSRGSSKVESLRRAKLEFVTMKPAYAHPRYWAAFVLSGDANAPIPLAMSWWWFGGPGALLLVLAGVLYLRS